MDPILILAAALVGYLSGSISFARIVAGRIDPTVDVTIIETVVGDGNVFTSTSASATAVRMKVGRRWGVLTGCLDMLKVALPVLAFSLLFPAEPYRFVAAAAGHVGHNHPLYHRFIGGRGETSIYGALWVIDPIGAILMICGGAVLGFLAGNILVFRWGGMALMIPWFALTKSDPAYLAWILFAVGFYLFSMRPELTQYAAMQATGHKASNEEVADEFGMGARLGRAIDRYGIPALVGRLRGAPAQHGEGDA
jgi:glycerol-3-phosphate acyltransferase PlsY